jgi:hypothetical protein
LRFFINDNFPLFVYSEIIMMRGNEILKKDLELLKNVVVSTKNIGYDNKEIVLQLIDRMKDQSFTYKFVINYIKERKKLFGDEIKFSTLRLQFHNLLKTLRKNKDKFINKDFYKLIDLRISYFNSAIQNTIRILKEKRKKKENELLDYTNEELKKTIQQFSKRYLSVEEEILLKMLMGTYFEINIVEGFENIIYLSLENKNKKELFIKYNDNNIPIIKRYIDILKWDKNEINERDELYILINMLKEKNIQSILKNLKLKIGKYLNIPPNIVTFRYSFTDYVLHNVKRFHDIELLKYIRGLPEFVIS